LYWLDTADSQPCIGTGGIAAWQLTAFGAISLQAECNRGSGLKLTFQWQLEMFESSVVFIAC
jgi:hypothetical protein